jgi:hypothetical protein
VFYTKLRYFSYRAFGVAAAGSNIAPIANLHNVATLVDGLDGTSESSGEIGRTWLCPPDLRSEPIVMFTAENNPASGIISGVIGIRRRKNLPDVFNATTGDLEELGETLDLVEKSHFLIDTTRKIFVFQKSMHSPNLSMIARYLQVKTPSEFYSMDFEPIIRPQIMEKLVNAARFGEIKTFYFRIRRSYIDYVSRLQEPRLEDAVRNLATLNTPSIGISLGVEKYSRNGLDSFTRIVENVKRFMGIPEGIDIGEEDYNPEIEQLAFDLEGDYINLLSSSLTVNISISDEHFARNIDSTILLEEIKRVYLENIIPV